jgi:hypothetical protein
VPKDQEIFGKQIPMVDSNEVLIGLPQLLVRLWHQLKQRRKKQFIAIVSLVLISAMAEVVSLGAILSAGSARS